MKIHNISTTQTRFIIRCKKNVNFLLVKEDDDTYNADDKELLILVFNNRNLKKINYVNISILI